MNVPTLIVLLLAVSVLPSTGNVGLLAPYYQGPLEFVEVEISDSLTVFYHQRMLGDAVVEGDFIVYQIDSRSGELLKRDSHWTWDTPPQAAGRLISEERATELAGGQARWARLYIISPDSDVFRIAPAPRDPCWAVSTILENATNALVVVNAVTGDVIGRGIAPPYTAFSLTGPTGWDPCSGSWSYWAENAQQWFGTMGYPTETIVWPTSEEIQDHVESIQTAMFYELAHGGSSYFCSGCADGTHYEATSASDIESWMTNYTKMPFAFIGSCEGLCSVGDNTLSYEFRKGSSESTVTVGYCGMGESYCSDCWTQSINWQDDLFYYMSIGWTARDAFDQANADYPMCASSSCMRFSGDDTMTFVPVVTRVPVADWYALPDPLLAAGSGNTNVASWGDYDGDGDSDLFVGNKTEPDLLLENEGLCDFSDATQAPLGDDDYSTFATWGDYDNDGDEDLYITKSDDHANVLYKNTGGGTFQPVTTSPLNDAGKGRCGPWVDYDNDGLLDLFVGNHGTNRLLRNLGGDDFSNETPSCLEENGNSQCAAWGDYNNDGLLDVYIVDPDEPNVLARNDGDGVFTPITGSPVNDDGAGRSAVWGDYDNDGDLDLYLGNNGENKLFKNEDGTFVDVTTGPLGGSDNTLDVAWCDFDNDGDLDLYISNYGANRLLTNDPILGFADVTPAPLEDSGDSKGIALADCDGDGLVDIYLAADGDNRLFWNQCSPSVHWLHVELVGVVSNRSAIGARVRILANGQTQIREVDGGAGFRSFDSLPVEFGLFATTVVDSVIVRWPSGIVNRYSDVAADQHLVLVENLPPERPSGLVAVAQEDGVELYWSASDEGDIDHYAVERDTSSAFDAPFEIVVEDTTCLDSPLVNGETYWYRVSAFDTGELVSAFSETVACMAGIPPAAPDNLFADSQEGIITVSWSPNSESDLDHYLVQSDTSDAFLDPSEIALADTTLIEYPPVHGVTCYYRVYAVDSVALVSVPSDTASCVSIQTAPPPPASPALAVGTDCMTAYWDPVGVPDFKQYHVERDTTETFGIGTLTEVITDTSIVHCLIQDGQEYFYRVRTEDLLGIMSQPSSVVSAVASQMPPPPPDWLVAEAGPTDEEITLTWRSVDVEDLDHYEMDRDTTALFGAGTVSLVYADTTCVSEQLTVGAEYWYRVFATDLVGQEGALSETVSCMAGLPPQAPHGLAVQATEGSNHVSWLCDEPPDFDHYLVERDTSSLFADGTLQTEVGGHQWTDSDIDDGEEYFYRVMGIDIHGLTSAPSDTMSCIGIQTAPGAPWGLTAASEDDGVRLEWQAEEPPDFNHYAIERDTSQLFAAGVEAFACEDTSYVDYTVGDGVQYFYRVHAVDDHGLCSDPSDTVSCVGEQSAPSVPAGLRALGGSSSVVLMWEDAPEPDVSGFVVYRDTAASFSYPDSVGFSEESGFTDVNVDLYRNYWYSVASRDYFGLESGLSETLAALPVAGDPVCVDIVNADPYQQDGTLARPFDSIQEGIDHSSPGNAVLVFPGVYGESVTIDNDIDVMGLEGPEVTVIEGNVTVSGVGAARRFSGFAVDGLGNVQITLDVHDSDLLVDGCILRNASDACVSLNGDSESLLTHCEFIQGTYGVSVSDSSHPSIVVSRFEGNSIAHVFAEDEADANVGGSLLDASDLMSGPSLMVFNIGAGEVVAEYNWWGTLCPETDWFLGAVDYVPWTDDLHEQAYDECPSDVDEELPLVHALDQNYPNPFNPTTWISYDVPAPGGEVVLRVFAPSGRLVRTLADGYAPSGSYSVEWDGRDDRGVSVSSGVYLYQIQVGDFVDQKKMLLLK